MDKMFQKFINNAADKVWYWWEENKFEDEGLGDINKVAQFSDWIDDCDNESLAGIGGVIWEHDNEFYVNELRKTITKGINHFFEENHPLNYLRGLQ